MPRATINRDETHRRELRTAPPDGYVSLRKLSYYEMMQRRELAGKIVYEQRTQQTRRNQSNETMRSMLELAQVAVMEFEFKNCIVEHNLEDDKGMMLDFGNPLTLRSLDPKIGSEIGRYIEELNLEDDEDVAPFTNAVTSSSQDGVIGHENITERMQSESVSSGSESLESQKS